MKIYGFFSESFSLSSEIIIVVLSIFETFFFVIFLPHHDKFFSLFFHLIIHIPTRQQLFQQFNDCALFRVKTVTKINLKGLKIGLRLLSLMKAAFGKKLRVRMPTSL